jgi:hypothetical protein
MITLKELKNKGYKKLEYNPDIIFNKDTDFVNQVHGEGYEEVMGLDGYKWRDFINDYPIILRKTKIRIKKIV